MSEELRNEIFETVSKSREEALRLAVNNFSLENEEELDYEITEVQSSSLFGMLESTSYRISAKVKDVPLKGALKELQDIISLMGIDVEAELIDETINIKGEDVGLLIGKRGQTLNAFQYLVNIIVNKNTEEGKKNFVTLDANDYRATREKKLSELALKLAGKVKKTGRSIELEPMITQDRKIIHTALKDYSGVYSYSKANEPYRRVVISSVEKKKTNGSYQEARVEGR